jgi:hypothetical protein
MTIPKDKLTSQKYHISDGMFSTARDQTLNQKIKILQKQTFKNFSWYKHPAGTLLAIANALPNAARCPREAVFTRPGARYQANLSWPGMPPVLHGSTAMAAVATPGSTPGIASSVAHLVEQQPVRCV